MTAPTTGYSRTTFRAPARGPLTSEDAEALIGSEMSVSLHDVVVAGGTITDCRPDPDGRHLLITVESGGRRCPACGHIYREDEADNRMASIATLRQGWVGRYPAGLAVYTDLPSWVRVCTAWAECEHRRTTGPPT